MNYSNHNKTKVLAIVYNVFKMIINITAMPLIQAHFSGFCVFKLSNISLSKKITVIPYLIRNIFANPINLKIMGAKPCN